MTDINVTYMAPKTLGEFMMSNDFVRAIVGPVGSGKSSVCVIEILRRAMAQAPGTDGVRRTRFAVIRNTYPQLRDTTRKTFEQWIPEGLGRWHEQEFTFEMDFSLPTHGRIVCEVLFRALDRPQDVKKLLSLELTGAYVNELREVPQHVFNVLQSRVGRFPSKAQGGPTWFGVWADTNPWETMHWGYKLFSKDKPHGHALFEQPGGREPTAENLENLPPGYYERLVAGKDSEWVESYVDGKYPDSTIGSIFGRAISAVERRGAIYDFDYTADGIITSWDLGLSDSTAIWFWKPNRGGAPDLVDHYENHGEPLSHYFEVIEDAGYSYRKHFLPHDARARSLQTGVSTLQQFISRYGAGSVAITPELSIADGIEAARWLLEQPIRIHKTNCAEGLDALRAYKYEWDEESQVFARRPNHDWTSHSADAFRYIACAVKNAEGLLPPVKEAIRPVKHPGWQLGELFDAEESERPRSRI